MIKSLIKKTISIIRHPIVSAILLLNGSKDFVIGRGLQINRLHYFKVGRKVSIGNHARLLFVPEYGGEKCSPSLMIGNNVSIGNRFSALCADKVIIEDNNLIASDVLITSENHGTDLEASVSYADNPLNTAPVIIGKGCWIGEKVSIMPGVELGERCIVACNSVVTKSFPSGSMIAGAPAKLIKQYDSSKHEWIRVLD